MKLSLFIGLFLISQSLFASDKMQIICKGFSGETKLQAQLEVPENLFMYQGTSGITSGIDSDKFDPKVIASQITGVAGDGSKSFQVNLKEVKDATDVTGYNMTMWFGTPQAPTATVYINSFLIAWSKNVGGSTIMSMTIVGNNTDDMLSVLSGTVDQWVQPKAKESIVLCRLTPIIQ